MTMKNMYRLVVAVVALTIRLDARTLAGIFPECSVIHITFKDNLKAINHDKNSITIGFLRTTRVRGRARVEKRVQTILPVDCDSHEYCS